MGRVEAPMACQRKNEVCSHGRRGSGRQESKSNVQAVTFIGHLTPVLSSIFYGLWIMNGASAPRAATAGMLITRERFSARLRIPRDASIRSGVSDSNLS